MYDDGFHDPMYQLMKYGERAYNGLPGLSQINMFKDFARERFMNMVQNCKIYNSGGDMYVQVDKCVYRKITHEILGRFEHVAFVNVHYQVVETYPDDVPYCILEDTITCQELKEAVIAIHQMAQYMQIFNILGCKFPDDVQYIMPPIDVKVHYVNGETFCYPDIIMFNDDFFRPYEEVDPNGFISV